jgi:glycogen(starch) synthase
MRIHVLTNLFPPDVLGGYELLTQDVAAGLRARGHVVTVVTTGEGMRVGDTARILRLARRFDTSSHRDRARHLVVGLANRWRLHEFLDGESRPDAVLVMSLRRLGVEPARVYARRGIPQVFTVNDDWPLAYSVGLPRRAGRVGAGLASDRVGARAWLARWMDRGPWSLHTWRDLRPTRVVFLSDSVRSNVLRGGAPFPQGLVCAQGVDPTMFTSRPFRPIRAAPRLLFVGRLHPSKAPEVAIEALASLRRRGVEARLTVAGAPVSPEYGKELRAHAERHGVAEHVEWLGYVERGSLNALYADCDVFLYPLRGGFEAQGLTYMEAMAVGTPVVGFPEGGAKELLADHPVLLRAATCDGDGFADAIEALRHDSDAQRVLVDNGRDWLLQFASLDHYIDTLESELGLAARGAIAHSPQLAKEPCRQPLWRLGRP